MDAEPPRPRWSLPYSSPLPADPRRRAWARAARALAYVLLAAALIGPVMQFQRRTAKALRKAEDPAAVEKGLKTTTGAIGRWRKAIRAFWAGQDIYRSHQEQAAAESDDAAADQGAWLHPHMPFTVILLTPLAYMPAWLTALSFNVLKILVLAGGILMAVRLANHEGRRMPDWLLGLALLWSMLLIVDDIQHGNTNGFVLGAIVFQLWLYRRGRDLAAGTSLALAICLKMTPALFLLYWLYQRNWKLLCGAAAALVVFAAVIPVAVLGPSQYVDHTGSWLRNLILPGLVKGAWYPIHINQSVSGVFSRYFLKDQPAGDINWNPDDMTYAAHVQASKTDPKHKGPTWIAFASFSPGTVKWLIRCFQGLIVVAMACAIGWRKLPRDDGRRALHYGLIVLGMMLLNQRTWQHHAGVLLVAHLAVWYAIGFGLMSRRARGLALSLMLLAGLCAWLDSGDVYKVLARLTGRPGEIGEDWSNLVKAYGLTFYHFLLALVASIVLAVSLRNLERPYAEVRQKVFS